MPPERIEIASVSTKVSKGLERHVEPDLVPELEAIGHRPSAVGDQDRDPFEDVLGDARGQGLATHPHDAKRWIVDCRSPSLVADGEPDLERCLRRELVVPERREQADHPTRHSGRCHRQAVVLRDRRPGQPIHPAAHSLHPSGGDEAAETRTRDAERHEIAWTDDGAMTSELEDLGGRSEHGPKRRR